MTETIRQRIDREIQEQLAAMPKSNAHYNVKIPTCVFCAGVMREIGPMAMQCDSCGAITRR